MKMILIATALLSMPAASLAAAHMEKKDAAKPTEATMAGTTLPKCTAKVQDSCDQSMTTEKNALGYYPADSRDAGNNKIAGAKAMPKPM